MKDTHVSKGHEVRQRTHIFSFATLQWMLQEPNACSFMGCIGKDEFGEEMTKNCSSAGVKVIHLFGILRELQDLYPGALSSHMTGVL